MTGRPKTTGRFNTRRELVDRVRHLYFQTDMSVSSVARNCGVSQTTANNIIESKEEAEVIERTDYGDDIKTIHDLSCGCGYMPDECIVHLPQQIKDALEL